MIYLLRHGETVFNKEGRIQGGMESELNALGERQAVAMAEQLDDSIIWALAVGVEPAKARPADGGHRRGAT